MTTPVDIANRALAEIGTRSQLTGTVIDPSQGAEALYSALLYAPLRDFLLREGDYDWSMQDVAAIAASGATTPWIYGYQYPSGAIRIRQLVPTTYDPFDPRPVQWNIINIAGTRTVVTRAPISRILYTSAPIEDLWDSIFTESFVRLLGSSLAFALENRIEAADAKLREAISFAGIANLRDA